MNLIHFYHNLYTLIVYDIIITNLLDYNKKYHCGKSILNINDSYSFLSLFARIDGISYYETIVKSALIPKIIEVRRKFAFVLSLIVRNQSDR